MPLPASFHGIVPPVVTPLTHDFKVDYPSFTRVIENLLEGGVHGLFVLGSTSEVVFHDEATRRAILDHAVKVNNGRVPLLAGVIDPTTDRVIGHSKVAKAAGADAVVVTAPFYTRTSQPETLRPLPLCQGRGGPARDRLRHPRMRQHQARTRNAGDACREGAIAGVRIPSGDEGSLPLSHLGPRNNTEVF